MSSPLAGGQLLLPAEVAVIVPYGQVSGLARRSDTRPRRRRWDEKQTHRKVKYKTTAISELQ